VIRSFHGRHITHKSLWAIATGRAVPADYRFRHV
jgi:hypothetical protein